MNTAIQIYKATEKDVAIVREIAIQTFLETFREYNTEENMKAYLANTFSTEKIKLELNDPHTSIYLALHLDDVVGYLKLKKSDPPKELESHKVLEIERIYVLKDFHGKRVGLLLLERAIAIAKEHHLDYLWLGVWEHNPRAIRFYEKNGFNSFGNHVFVLGDDKQNDLLMKRALY
ncbi:MAG: GNAT family N-acetyltransferase [Flavobacteriales bacterium]